MQFNWFDFEVHRLKSIIEFIDCPRKKNTKIYIAIKQNGYCQRSNTGIFKIDQFDRKTNGVPIVTSQTWFHTQMHTNSDIYCLLALCMAEISTHTHSHTAQTMNQTYSNSFVYVFIFMFFILCTNMHAKLRERRKKHQCSWLKFNTFLYQWRTLYA